MFVVAETGRTMTFGDVDELSTRIAQWAVARGLQTGDTVALMMDNRPEYVAIWLGLAKAGITTALLNTNTKGKPLVHAITVAGCVAVIIGTEHVEEGRAVETAIREGGVRIIATYHAHGLTDHLSFGDESLDETLPMMSVDRVDRWKKRPATDPVFYIYTSGTTGLPKACNLSHVKVTGTASLFRICGVTTSDVIYGSGMPMYHTAANLGVVFTMLNGATYVVRQKFSATNFFHECGKYQCTVSQYIGELCRYLLAVPDNDTDTKHKLRIAIGNGLRPEIWNTFQRRFNVPEIGEFYGATEGNSATVNHCRNYQGQGAVGRAGLILQKAMGMKIVKFDVENEVPIRDQKTGFCAECAHDEPGELVAAIKTMKTSTGEMSNFEGYTSKDATEKKILRDAFVKGDAYFRTGDLLRKDSRGYFYFVDRIGDTFRWKGENVSTMEVSEVLSSFPGIVDANVFGAAVAGKDGRACMVALTLEDGASINPVDFATHCRANLPSYSIPVFVRFLPKEVDLTGTFKHKKVEYRNEGCDPTKVSDTMWWYSASSGAYEPYGVQQYQDITSGRSKL